MLGFSISMAEAEECILLELLQFKRLARGKKSPLAKAMQSIIINDCIFLKTFFDFFITVILVGFGKRLINIFFIYPLYSIEF